tara:strand:- start:656 stop:1573 length:918 start_codon:yes stop_codon:yes gene_type:complete
MAKYVGWKYYHALWRGLDFIESTKIPFYPKADDEDEQYEISDKYFLKNITSTDLSLDANADADRLVILKISDKKELEELRIVSCKGFGINDFSIKDLISLNIPLGDELINEGYNKKVIEEPYDFKLETGNLSLINYYEYMVHKSRVKTPYEVGKLVLDSQEKNNKQLKKMEFNEKLFEFVQVGEPKSSQFGFSFTWEKGDYEINTLKLEKHKIILNNEDVFIHFPCCNRNIAYDLKYRNDRWGVISAYCEECDKKNHGWDKYLTYQNKTIDFNVYGIKGYKDQIASYPFGTVIRPSRFTSDIEWK